MKYMIGGDVNDLISACPALVSHMEKTTEVAGYLWEKGWAEGNGGNLSVDVTDCLSGERTSSDLGPPRKLESPYPDLSGRSFLVTGAGCRFRDYARDPAKNACILELSENGGGYRLVWGGKGGPGFRPTSELPSHLRIHEHLRRLDFGESVVLHTHPTELIALTHLPEYREEAALNRALWSMIPEVKVIVPRGVGLVPYTLPGSEALALASVKALRRGRSVVLWEMHGCLAAAADVMVAFDLIDTLNKSARLILACRGAGHIPRGLGEAQLDELVRAFGLKE